ncbi:MAG TPA: malto-oligosyltrehalose synthase [Candidatus Acidoferrales bacterium]|jgi:(1->4)-alpha-D-glucan 1-alpha-D-glucosylmutase|nr:malto-oligosyltrehalose synthase [Candidatus Acidoferrales bacterium]
MIESSSISSTKHSPKSRAAIRTIPRATYRLQFNEHFRLADALPLVSYFHELEISHIYASPLFKAAAHSGHGYDVCDFGQLNPEIGTEDDLQKLIAALREYEMGLILDIVPNHMGISTAENSWWQDVLKNGRASRFANYFDIQWDSADSKLQGKILLPVLGDHYQRVLQRGELRIQTENGEPTLCYFENKFPLAPDSLPKNFSVEQLNADLPALDALVQKQNYALIFWGEGDLKLNYRRFFAVSTLAGVCVEDEAVFNDVHVLLKQWLKKNWLDGLRVDHPDGLRDPKTYLERLRALAPDLWIVVEKILQPEEQTPEDWPVEGTVGYEFLNQLNGLFVDLKNEKALLDFYFDFTGEPAEAGKMVREKKRLVLETLFITEVNRLTDLLVEIAAHRPAHQKFSREHLHEALIEFTACFPIYRTYVRPVEQFVDENDVLYIEDAAAIAKKSRPDLSPELFDFLNDLLLLLFHGGQENEFVARFQQLSGPAMAKGVEDTTFYCRNCFLSLNEVGGDPGRFGVNEDEFHEFCLEQYKRNPHSLIGSSTHDTKRSEDVRARLNVLSEMPNEWSEAVWRWSKMNDRHRKNHFPDRNIEYVLYQTLVGSWPISPERLLAYMEKASCEAKQHTDWNHRDKQYDTALKDFVAAALRDEEFIRDLEKFIGSLEEPAYINSLAQTLIKLTAPGVPDIYQGNEIWDFSLVDPDNRRPVDFALRKHLFAEAKQLSAEETWKRRAEGLPKLWMIQRTLAFRAQHEAIFTGDYEPVFPRGERAEHVVAFIRGGSAMTVVPRFTHSVAGEMPVLHLPDGKWRNEFTGENFSGEADAGDVLKKFPVALLVRE